MEGMFPLTITSGVAKVDFHTVMEHSEVQVLIITVPLTIAHVNYTLIYSYVFITFLSHHSSTELKEIYTTLLILSSLSLQ